MEEGYYTQAAEALEAFFSIASDLEWDDGPELAEVLAEGRHLAGELRGRISEVAIEGRHSLGARGEPPVAKIEGYLRRARDLMNEGYIASASQLLETIQQALWYWENTNHPEIRRLTEEARRLGQELESRPEMGSPVTPEIEKRYTSGGCPFFAIALHERTKWPLALLIDQAAEPESWGGRKKYPPIAHVFVLTPGGWAMDVRGERPVASLKEEWYDLREPAVEIVTLKELKALMGENRPLEACNAGEMREARQLVDEILGRP